MPKAETWEMSLSYFIFYREYNSTIYYMLDEIDDNTAIIVTEDTHLMCIDFREHPTGFHGGWLTSV